MKKVILVLAILLIAASALFADETKEVIRGTVTSVESGISHTGSCIGLRISKDGWDYSVVIPAYNTLSIMSLFIMIERAIEYNDADVIITYTDSWNMDTVHVRFSTGLTFNLGTSNRPEIISLGPTKNNE